MEYSRIPSEVETSAGETDRDIEDKFRLYIERTYSDDQPLLEIFKKMDRNGANYKKLFKIFQTFETGMDKSNGITHFTLLGKQRYREIDDLLIWCKNNPTQVESVKPLITTRRAFFGLGLGGGLGWLGNKIYRKLKE